MKFDGMVSSRLLPIYRKMHHQLVSRTIGELAKRQSEKALSDKDGHAIG